MPWSFAEDRRFMEIAASSKSFDEVTKRTRRNQRAALTQLVQASAADKTGLYSADLARFCSQNSSSRPAGLPWRSHIPVWGVNS
jgi:hypothetical protein